MQTPIDKQPAPRAFAPFLLICCAVAFACYLGSYMRLPVVPLYARSLGADTVQVGIINSAFLLMAGLLSLPLGILSDRVGKKLLACVGLLVLAATSFLLYFSKSPTQMVWIYLLFGVGLAAFGPTMMSIVADFSPPTHLGRAYGWYTTALYTAMSIGPALGGAFAHRYGFRPVFLISGASILVTFWIVVFFLPRPGVMTHGETAFSDRGLGAAAKLLRNRPLLGCWLATLGGCFGLGMFVTFLPLHAQNLNLGVGQIGLVFSIQGICNAIARIPFGHLSDKVAKRGHLVIVGCIGFAGSMAGFGISRNVGHFLVFSVLLGTSMALAFTSVGALIAETAPPQLRGLAMGGYNTSIYFGMMLSSALMGPVIRVMGFEAGFFATALIIALFAALFFVLVRAYRPEKSAGVS